MDRSWDEPEYCEKRCWGCSRIYDCFYMETSDDDGNVYCRNCAWMVRDAQEESEDDYYVDGEDEYVGGWMHRHGPPTPPLNTCHEEEEGAGDGPPTQPLNTCHGEEEAGDGLHDAPERKRRREGSTEGGQDAVKRQRDSIGGSERDGLMLLACASGNIAMIQALAIPGFEWKASHAAACARAGHLDALKYLHSQDCPWDGSVVQAASDNGQGECLRFLVARGCPTADTDDTTSASL